MNANFYECLTVQSEFHRTGLDRTWTKSARNLPFNVDLSGKYFDRNLVTFLGLHSENLESGRNRWGL